MDNEHKKEDVSVTMSSEEVVINVTETTLRELLMACAQAKMSGMTEAHIRSDHHKNWFNVNVEVKKNTQESLGYRLVSGKV